MSETSTPEDEVQVPGAVVRLLDTTIAQPGSPTGEKAEVAVVHDSGATFFHTLRSLPARFIDETGNVLIGRHDGVTTEEASTSRAP
jgi:hypothetical protein